MSALSAEVEPGRKGTTVTVVDSSAAAESLAHYLLDPVRSKPVVVVTASAGQPGPYIDVQAIIDAVTDLADVYVMATGSISFALSARLPERTQVYGGAGRVYPVENAWQTDPYAAPLRFAYGTAQGQVATSTLIADALGAVHASGLSTERAGATVQQVEGKVKALPAASRAWIRTADGGDATIWHDLLFPGLPIDRVFRVGMQIRGALDVEERRIDVSASLRKPREALADYPVGAVVLARVVKLDNIAAEVELYPGVRTGMSATEVTGNPMDLLTGLMSIDEVLPVRVVARGGHDGRRWRLSMLDVEDSEQILASPSLLPEGPPWLALAEDVPEASTAPHHVEPAAQPEGPVADKEPPRFAELSSLASHSETPPKPSPPVADESGTLRRQVAELEKQLLRAQTLVQAVQIEGDEFREQASESLTRIQRLQQSARKARTDLRTEKQKSQHLAKQLKSVKAESNGHSSGEVLFLDPEAQFRFEVDVAYAHRIPPGDKVIRPRRELRLGPDFLASLCAVEGIDHGKVVDVTVEVITDLVSDLEGRELHPLREGVGAAERPVVRAGDGARCMRVALQRKTPSARRLHYWKVEEAIELSRVVRHDDMTP